MSTIKTEAENLLVIGSRVNGTYKSDDRLYEDLPPTFKSDLEQVNPLKVAVREVVEESIQRGLEEYAAGRVSRRDDLLDEE